MFGGVAHGIAIHDDLLDAIQSVTHWYEFLSKPEGNY